MQYSSSLRVTIPPLKMGEYQESEARIPLALSTIKRGEKLNLRQLSRDFDVPYYRLQHRFHGRPSKSEHPQSHRRLSLGQEQSLI